MIRATIIDRTPHLRMNGVARYMLGITTHPNPKSLGCDLRVLNWGRELKVMQWRRQFSPSVKPNRYATRLNRKYLRPLAQRWSHADVIHYPFHYVPDDWTAGRSAKVVTVHGASAFSKDLYEPARGERIKRGLHLGIESNSLAKVITGSEWSKSELVKFFELEAEKIAVLPYGVDLDLFRPLPDASHLSPVQRPYLLHVGPCEPRKNLVRLIRAFAQLKHFYKIPHVLVMAGSPGRMTETVQNEIHQLGIADAVVMAGIVNDDALLNLYNGADLFVFPSLYEGFGIPVLEAMACGTPVVTSNSTALPEIAGGAAALVDDPTDVDNLAEVCQQVLNDTTMQETLRQSGLAHVQQYTWHNCAVAHLQLYKQVAEGEA